MSHVFQDFLQANDIISQRSCPSTLQQNGVAKRKNHHLPDVVLILLLESSVPSHFWCEALSATIYLINRLPSPILNHNSPFARIFTHSPNYSTLHTFGCVYYINLPAHERAKLIAQSVKCTFLGYSIHQKGFLYYDPHQSRIQISRNLIFIENQYFFTNHKDTPSSSFSMLPFFANSFADQDSSKPLLVYKRRPTSLHPYTPSLVADPVPTTSLRRSTRVSKPPYRYIESFTTTLNPTFIPTSYR